MAHIDKDLRALVLRCLNLNSQAQAIERDGANDSPEAAQLDAELCAAVLEVRRTPAESLDGILAKVDLLWQLADGRDAFLQDDLPLDPGLVSQSVFRDLARFAGHDDERV
jgi:hypothetical protein